MQRMELFIFTCIECCKEYGIDYCEKEFLPKSHKLFCAFCHQRDYLKEIEVFIEQPNNQIT